MNIDYICSECGKRYSPYEFPYLCTCGGMLNLDEFENKFSLDTIIEENWSIFRYLKALPFKDDLDTYKTITMGEGLTTMVPLDPKQANILVKMDYMMPTLSFKDRGASLLISKAKEFGAKKVIQDSSGNAGNSIAAYANRIGMECDIYVPESTSPKKIKMIRSHGASVHIIPGSREDTARAALSAVEKGDHFYASHVYNPYFYQGTKTYVYEVFEQLKGNMVDTFIVPVGNGTLLLGVYYGLKDLMELGLIDEMPRIIGVQAEKCAPIYRSFKAGLNYVEEVENKGTQAEGIAIGAPKRGKQILEAIRKTNGDIILSPEEKILDTQLELAKKGFFVELTTAATFAAFKYNYKNKTPLGKVLLPLTGAGLKSEK